jgi:hypothetical protein
VTRTDRQTSDKSKGVDTDMLYNVIPVGRENAETSIQIWIRVGLWAPTTIRENSTGSLLKVALSASPSLLAKQEKLTVTIAKFDKGPMALDQRVQFVSTPAPNPSGFSPAPSTFRSRKRSALSPSCTIDGLAGPPSNHAPRSALSFTSRIRWREHL